MKRGREDNTDVRKRQGQNARQVQINVLMYLELVMADWLI